LYRQQRREKKTQSSFFIAMADFDAIYEEQDDIFGILDVSHISLSPEPVVIRGAGNITV
jgi:hypothetical protein